MKKFSFAAGMLTMALIGSVSIGALAATGQLTITVDPINIQVNGETFAPKDATGADVPVFAYNGTTYAPLRALAEAYGLEVGYDSESNMATVSDPETISQGSEPESVSRVEVKLAKVGDKYYYTGQDNSHGIRFTMLIENGNTLLFTDDISVNTSGIKKLNASGEYEDFPYCTSWYFNYILRLALLKDFDVEESSNPYVDGVVNIKEPNLTLDGYLTAGVDATQYISANKNITPMWIEYNGKRLYQQNDLPNGLFTVNGIRYYDGNICMNDVLSYFGIDKTITVGQYSDTWYIEVA